MTSRHVTANILWAAFWKKKKTGQLDVSMDEFKVNDWVLFLDKETMLETEGWVLYLGRIFAVVTIDDAQTEVRIVRFDDILDNKHSHTK